MAFIFLFFYNIPINRGLPLIPEGLSGRRPAGAARMRHIFQEVYMSILEVREVRKTYTTRLGSNRVEALRNVSFSVEQGEYVAINGRVGLR